MTMFYSDELYEYLRFVKGLNDEEIKKVFNDGKLASQAMREFIRFCK